MVVINSSWPVSKDPGEQSGQHIRNPGGEVVMGPASGEGAESLRSIRSLMLRGWTAHSSLIRSPVSES